MAAITSVAWGSFAISNGIRSGSTYSVIITYDEAVSGLTEQGGSTIPTEFNISGDISRLRFSSQSDGTVWTYTVTIPSSVSSNRSFRIQMPRTRPNPDLDEDLDWTLGWNASGQPYASPTDILAFPELAITLSENIVASGESITATFDFTEVGLATLTEFTAEDVTVTEGVTKGPLVKVSNTQYTMQLTAPTTGNGQAVVSVSEDVILPRNTAASATFDYIDEINAEISLSANRSVNSGIIIAQFDFDYDVPNFSEAAVSVGAGGSKGNATALDDNNRCWIVPITVPQSGEGELEISLEEDAIGFRQAAVQAPIFYQSQVPLSISGLSSLIEWGYDTERSDVFADIQGDRVYRVDVNGLVRPFFHHWDATQGRLYIYGKPDVFYEDLEFNIIAYDTSGSIQQNYHITVVEELVPLIIIPDKPLRIQQGVFNEFEIEIQNHPEDVKVYGLWAGLNHNIGGKGVIISGDIPSANLYTLGNTEGVFTVESSNRRGDGISREIPWETAISKPSISGAFRNSGRVNISYSGFINVQKNGGRNTEIFVNSGSLPPGLMLSERNLSSRILLFIQGIPDSAGTFTFDIRAQNTSGFVVSPTYTITIT